MENSADSVVGRSYPRLVIRDATIVNGIATPAEGPVDLVIEGDRIKQVVRVDPVSLARYPEDWQRPEGDRVIDARAMCILPGLVDMHAHVPTNPAHCGPGGRDYAEKLWLAHGVTTLRVAGVHTEELYTQRRLSEEHPELPVPRMVILHHWPSQAPLTAAQARAEVRRFRDLGANGIKLHTRHLIMDPPLLEAVCDEGRNVGMEAGAAIHLALNTKINAVEASDAGVCSIEHTYGIPEAAMPGVQSLPLGYNEMDELARFRESALDWPEAERYHDRVLAVLERMVANGTVWNPTMATYEANRDLMRAQTKVWIDRYVTPQLLRHWTPTPGVHASFHFDWRTSDEVAWRRKFRIWMKYLNAFFGLGGKITAGSDAGSLYTHYGFSMVRELELLQESGFHPLDAVRMATTNSKRVLGLMDHALGIRAGAPADLAVVDGNPLENFKVMYGTGVERYLPDRVTKVKAGGVRWTIRDGVVFDAQELLKEVERHVETLKAKASDSK